MLWSSYLSWNTEMFDWTICTGNYFPQSFPVLYHSFSSGFKDPHRGFHLRLIRPLHQTVAVYTLHHVIPSSTWVVWLTGVSENTCGGCTGSYKWENKMVHFIQKLIVFKCFWRLTSWPTAVPNTNHPCLKVYLYISNIRLIMISSCINSLPSMSTTRF